MYARVMGNGMIQTAPFSKITGRSLLEMKIIITKEIMAKKVENFRTCGYWYALENVFFMILGGYYYSSLPILINYLLLQGLDKDQEQSVLSEVFNSVLHRHFTKSPSALLTSSRQAPLSEYSPSRTGCSDNGADEVKCSSLLSSMGVLCFFPHNVHISIPPQHIFWSEAFLPVTDVLKRKST